MRVKGLLLWAALALLGGCASPTAKLNQPPVDVTWETLPEYWVLVGDAITFNPVGGLPQLRYRPSEQNLQAIPARVVARFEVEVK